MQAHFHCLGQLRCSGAGTMGHGGARAPHFSRWLGTGGGTVEERLITIIYCNMPTINAKNQE